LKKGGGTPEWSPRRVWEKLGGGQRGKITTPLLKVSGKEMCLGRKRRTWKKSQKNKTDHLRKERLSQRCTRGQKAKKDRRKGHSGARGGGAWGERKKPSQIPHRLPMGEKKG